MFDWVPFRSKARGAIHRNCTRRI
uniref:Uncharacterized protein n=1 Tax=Rhizophora mucronata TaxID=61149 RepID=A0A2P2QKE6_RHIMU